MRFLATSDLHIRDYSKFTSWSGVVPDRLLVNFHLAHDLVELCKSESVSAILIAGDLFDVATNPPVVLNVVNEFLSILSSETPVLMIHGQHDLSTKTVDKHLRKLTALSIFESDQVKFFHDEVYSVDGTSIFFYGWSKETPSYKDADIFVGHGLVAGAKNPFGYEFQFGYDPEFLSRKYKFSVIGDIHKSQVFYGNVLIPGPPIQSSFSDDPSTGVWIVDTENWNFKFYPLQSDVYPRFIYVTDQSKIPADHPKNHYYQVLSTSRQKDTSSHLKTISTSMDLWGIIDEVILSLKDDRQEALRLLARKCYDEVITSNVESRKFPEIEIERISIRNFFSIKSFDYGIPEGIVSIVGDIGTGKSTFLDAICFGFYGSTTKGKFKSDIIPISFTPDGDTVVAISFRIKDNNYSILRSSSELKLFINGTETTGSRMSDTQRLIEEIIQISLSEYLCLIYFSQESGSFFGSMSNAQQMSLLTMFLGSHELYLDKMVGSVQSSFRHYKDEILRLEGSISSLNSRYDRDSRRLNELKSYQLSLRDRQIESLRYSPFSDASMEVIDLLLQDRPTDAVNLYFGIDFSETQKRLEALKLEKSKLLTKKLNVDMEILKLQSSQESLSDAIATQLKKLRYLKTGTCPECGQSLPVDDEELCRIVDDIVKKRDELKSSQSALESLKENKLRLEADIPKFDSRISELLELENKCNSFLSYKKSQVDLDFSELEFLEKSVSSYEEEKFLLKSQKSECEELYRLYEILAKKVFSDKGVRAKCVEYIGEMLSSEINSLFESIDSKIKVQISTVTYNKSGNLSTGFDVNANFNGTTINYRSASGGQKMIIDLVSIVSIYNLLSSLNNLPQGLFGFIAMDESIKYLDSKNIDTVRDIILSLCARTVFVVSHDEKLSSILSNNQLVVSLENGVSVYN